jgi:hypothetical protein
VGDNLVVQETQFGLMLSGTYASSVNDDECHSLLTLSPFSDDALRQFWDLEVIGIDSAGNEPRPTHPVLQKFNETVRYENGRYTVSLPWKEKHQELVNNRGIAEKRLQSLDLQLEKDQALRTRYNEIVLQMLSEGIVEEVVEEQAEGPVFYMPHRPVVRESSATTKVRPVFYASAPSYNGVSLNDCMEIGPSLQPLLLDMLLRFRRWPVAVCADITKAFLQVVVRPEDRDVHRFLWNDGGAVRVLRFTRVPFGNCCSPFLLNATVAYHLSLCEDSPVVRELAENMYVDDFISGADTEEAACELFEKAHSVMAQAGMVLTKLSTNSTKVSMNFERDVLTADGPEKVLVWCGTLKQIVLNSREFQWMIVSFRPSG